jgi:hypothetical protein
MLPVGALQRTVFSYKSAAVAADAGRRPTVFYNFVHLVTIFRNKWYAYRPVRKGPDVPGGHPAGL